MSRKFAHLDHDYLRGPSPAIWKTIPDGMADLGYGGLHIFYDFLDKENLTTQSAGALTSNGMFECYADAAETIASGTAVTVTDPSGLTAATDDAAAGYDVDTDYHIGTWTLACTGTNGECGIHGQNIVNSYYLGLRKLAFEARFALSSVTNSVPGVFVGLSNIQPDGSALVDSTGEIEASAAALGFSVLDADGDALRPTISENGGTITRYGTAALTAAKYIKAGFIIDPQAAPSKRGKFFINGVEQTTYLTQAIIEGANFPSGSSMGFTALAKATGATDFTLTLDWFKLFAEVDCV